MKIPRAQSLLILQCRLSKQYENDCAYKGDRQKAFCLVVGGVFCLFGLGFFFTFSISRSKPSELLAEHSLKVPPVLYQEQMTRETKHFEI